MDVGEQLTDIVLEPKFRKPTLRRGCVTWRKELVRSLVSHSSSLRDNMIMAKAPSLFSVLSMMSSGVLLAIGSPP